MVLVPRSPPPDSGFDEPVVEVGFVDADVVELLGMLAVLRRQTRGGGGGRGEERGEGGGGGATGRRHGRSSD